MFVPYKGAAPAITVVLGGQIQVHVSAKSVLLPLINSGKLRALVVTSPDRWPELPEVPTMRESGFDGFPTAQWFGLLAPAGTSDRVIGKLNAAVAARLTATDTKKRLPKSGSNRTCSVRASLAKCCSKRFAAGGRSHGKQA
jgi:tripartite-type tricarboxylate transporter receptor subunit TctC